DVPNELMDLAMKIQCSMKITSMEIIGLCTCIRVGSCIPYPLLAVTVYSSMILCALIHWSIDIHACCYVAHGAFLLFVYIKRKNTGVHLWNVETISFMVFCCRKREQFNFLSIGYLPDMSLPITLEIATK
ncbi:hypothetical protein ACJX0J_039045, partial [Zea mays]